MAFNTREIKVGRLLKPGVALMQRFRMPVKLAVMAVLLVIPLVVVTSVQVNRLLDDYRTAESEVTGARIVSAMGDLVLQVGNHRVQAYMVTSNDFEVERKATREALARVVSELDPLAAQAADFWPEGGWQRVRADIEPLLADQVNEWPAAKYTTTLQNLRRATLFVAEKSSLVLDPFADTYFLQSVISEHAIEWLNTISEMLGTTGVWLEQAATGPHLISP